MENIYILYIAMGILSGLILGSWAMSAWINYMRKAPTFPVSTMAATNPKLTQTSDLDESQKLIQKIRETILSQLLNHHPKLFSAVAKQKLILNEQKRKGIAIFISPSTFKKLMHGSNGHTTENIEELYIIMADLHTPVGFVGDLPIYISELLTTAPVFVVGAITWSVE